jgi:hypothetical protein
MKKLIILAACFAGLAAFVYFYEIAGKEARDQAEELQQSVLRIEQDKIRSIEIDRKGDDPVLLEKADGTWVIRKPIDALADGSTVDTMLRNLTAAKRDRTLEAPAESERKTYGLDEPGVRIRVDADGTVATLLVGSKDFSGSKLYVQLEGSPDVMVTSTSLETAVEKSPFDWRSKDALKFDRAKVEEIQIQRPNEAVEFQKRDGTWYLEAPEKEAADEAKVTSFLSTLEFAKAAQFVEEDPQDLGKYGLDHPGASVRLREAGSETWQQLDLGKADGENYFARSSGRSPVFTLKKEVFDDLAQDVENFREKGVLDVKQDQVSKLEIRRGDEVLAVRREDFKWIVESPAEDVGKEALAYKFWYPLDDMQFEEIQKNLPRPDKADVEVKVTLTDESVREFWFWKSGEDFMALRLGSGTGGMIKGEDFEKLQFKIADIVGSSPEPVP